MAGCLLDSMPLPELMLTRLDPWEIFIRIKTFSWNAMHLKVLFAKCWPFFLALNVLSNGKGVKGSENAFLGWKKYRVILDYIMQYFS